MRERGGGLLGPKGKDRPRGEGEAWQGCCVKAKALFRFLRAAFSFFRAFSVDEEEEGGVGKGAGAGMGWEEAPPRKGLLVDCLMAGRTEVRQVTRESTDLSLRVG